MTAVLDRRSALVSLACSALLPGAALSAPDSRPEWEATARIAAGRIYAPPHREAMVPVEGGRIYVRVNGDLAADRAALLLVHGGPGSTHANYLPFLALAGERAVVMYDQLDSGRSDATNDPRNWRVGRFVDEVDAVRRAFGLDHLHLYGGSWGGTIALEYAARQPGGLASVILQNPLVSTRRWLADANLLRESLPLDVQEMLRRCEGSSPPPLEQCRTADEAFNGRFLQRHPRPAELEAYRSALPIPFNQRIYETMWGRTEFVSTGILRTYDGEHLLARLPRERTLFITGQYDEARPETIADFARQAPGAEFAVIPGASHSISIDRPEELLAIVQLWLRRQDSG